MLILTQWDEAVNLNGIERIYTEDGRIIARCISGDCALLGRYRNGDRAIEVFREIVEAYKTPALKVDAMNFIIWSDSSVVYEMPEE